MSRRIIGGLALCASIFLVSLAFAAQDRATLRIPNGLAFAEVKGYEAWPVIAPSQTDDGIKAILGNAAMIQAYKDGFPANGRAVPDGAMMAKIEWSKEANAASPYPVNVPGTLKSLAFMVKDAKRFADSGGWGYGKFEYNGATNTTTPSGTGSACGYACHTRVKSSDFVFTNYARR